MASNATVLSLPGVSISVTGGLTGALLQQVVNVFASTTNPVDVVTLPGGVNDPTLPTAPDIHPNALVIPTDDTGTIIIPSGYDYVIYAGTGSLSGADASTALIGDNLTYTGTAGTVIGASGTETVTDNTNSAVLSFATGAVTVNASGNSDTVNLDNVSGADSIGLSGSGNTTNFDQDPSGSQVAETAAVAAAAGVATVGITGSDDVTNLGSGEIALFVLGSDLLNQTGGAATIVTSGAGIVTINATGGTTTIYDNNGGNTFSGGVSTEFVADGGAADTYNAVTGGADTIFAVTSLTYNGANAASTLFVGGAGAATVFAGTAATIYGGTGTGSYTEGTGSFFFQGSGGSDTILGGTTAASVTVWGNNNENTTVSQLGSASGGLYVAYGASDTLNATDARGGNTFVVYDATLPGGTNFTGNTTLVGSSLGGDAFDILAGTSTAAHTITIENWQASDTLNLSGFSAGDISTADAALASAGGSGATFTLSDNTTIKFVGTSPTHT
jgi:hypothetical protein